MVQPRKEQVKNLKTKYTKVSGISIGNGSETILTGSDLANFKNLTITKIVGGCDKKVPAKLSTSVGGWTFGSQLTGNQLSVEVDGTLYNINFVSNDWESNYISTSSFRNVLDRNINSSSTVATVMNVDGKIVISTVSSGKNSKLKITAYNVGVLSNFGFTNNSSVMSVQSDGADDNIRGIVTLSPDNGGGLVKIVESGTRNNVIDAGGVFALAYVSGRLKTIDMSTSGEEIFAKISDDIKFKFFKNGYGGCSVKTGSGQVNKVFKLSDLNTSHSISISTNINTVSVLMDASNTADSIVNKIKTSATITTTSIRCDQPAVMISSSSGMFVFYEQSSFKIKHGTGNEVTVSIPADVYTSTSLMAVLNQALPPTSLSTAISVTGVIIYGSIDSTITISNCSNDLREVYGLKNGLHTGYSFARKIGGDDIEFFNPVSDQNSTLLLSGSLSSFGIDGTTVSVASKPTAINTVCTKLCDVYVPENVEFHEEITSYDQQINDTPNDVVVERNTEFNNIKFNRSYSYSEPNKFVNTVLRTTGSDDNILNIIRGNYTTEFGTSKLYVNGNNTVYNWFLTNNVLNYSSNVDGNSNSGYNLDKSSDSSILRSGITSTEYKVYTGNQAWAYSTSGDSVGDDANAFFTPFYVSKDRCTIRTGKYAGDASKIQIISSYEGNHSVANSIDGITLFSGEKNTSSGESGASAPCTIAIETQGSEAYKYTGGIKLLTGDNTLGDYTHEYSGFISLKTGSSDYTSGSITLETGSGGSSGSSGSITLETGNGRSGGSSGSITLKTGGNNTLTVGSDIVSLNKQIVQLADTTSIKNISGSCISCYGNVGSRTIQVFSHVGGMISSNAQVPVMWHRIETDIEININVQNVGVLIPMVDGLPFNCKLIINGSASGIAYVSGVQGFLHTLFMNDLTNRTSNNSACNTRSIYTESISATYIYDPNADKGYVTFSIKTNSFDAAYVHVTINYCMY